MTALTDISDVINRMTGGNSGTPENLFYWIDSRVSGAAAVATVSGRWTSLWQYEKCPGGAGATPMTSTIPVNDTAGALFQTDPGGGRSKWLLGASGISTGLGTFMLYDRLVHQGGLSGTVTTAQTTNLPTTALTRYSGAASVGNQIWIEIYSIIGTTATTVTVEYTNQDGTTGRVSKAVAIGGTGLREVGRMIPVPLQDGDTGVRAIANVDLLATTGTAGAFGVLITRPIFTAVSINAGLGFAKNFMTDQPGVFEIQTDACLSWAFLAGSTTAPQLFGSLHFVES